MVATVAVVILYATFLMMEQSVFDGKMAQMSSDPRNAARIRQITSDINRRVGAYLSVKTAVNVLLGVVCWGIMALLGVQFAGLLAVLIGMLNYIPYAGSFFGVVIPVAMHSASSGSPASGLLAGLTAAQVVIGNFLDPYLMGSSLNLSPIAILVSLAVWAQLWGIAGAILAVPITSVMVIVFSEFAGTRPSRSCSRRTAIPEPWEFTSWRDADPNPRPGSRRHVLDLYLAETRQLFNSMDPAPFQERDLDPKAEAYIVEWAGEAPSRLPLGLMVHLGREPATEITAAMLREAVGDHFRRRARVAWARLPAASAWDASAW